jgi:threonine/homoserine/homoserine lactone efflux protein
MIVIATVAPGPNLLVVLNARVHFGYSAVRATIVGNLVANAIITLAAVLGAGALIDAGGEPLRIVYTVLGGCFLLYLGLKAITNAANASRTLQIVIQKNDRNRTRAVSHFRVAFLATMSNPKVLIFQSVVLPQFLSTDTPKLTQYLIMMTTIAISVTTIHLAYASLAGFALRIFKNDHRFAYVFHILSGVTFVGLSLLCLVPLVL